MPSIHLVIRAGLAAALVTAAGACVAYRPGSLQRNAPPGVAVVETGCLDVAAAIATDPIVAWPVVDLHFGNRCDRPVPVDLRAIGAFGRTRAGAIVPLVPYDPQAELRALPLEARSQGSEQLQYRDRRDLGPVGDDVIDVCVELGGLGGSAPQVRCFPRPALEPVAQAAVTP